VSQPNLGINYFALSLGVEYALNSYNIPVKTKKAVWDKVKRFDLVGGFSLKEDTGHVNNRVVLQLIGQRFWQTSGINGVTAGIMLEYQEQKVIQNEPFSGGVFFGNEFLIGQFRFGQQLGVYLFGGQDAHSQLFQNYYLRWLSKGRLILGAHLKVHGHVADYLSFQLGYSLL
jgi:hypothetical protein